MLPKSAYCLEDGTVNRDRLGSPAFRYDILRDAVERHIPVPQALGDFFRKEAFTKHEMGRFALATNIDGNAILAGVALVHALQLAPNTVGSARILEDYINLPEATPHTWGCSWAIDALMGWPPGTTCPESTSLFSAMLPSSN